MNPVHFGSWSLPAVPQDWEVVPQHGIRRPTKKTFQSNVCFTEEPMAAGKDLAGYIEDQISALRHLMPDLQVSGPDRCSFPGCEEAQKLLLRYSLEGHTVIQGQIYVQSGASVGILTLTTIEEEIAEVRDTFDLIRRSAQYRPKPSSPAGSDKQSHD